MRGYHVYQQTQPVESSTLATLLEAQRLPSDKGVMVHALAALQSKLPCRCLEDKFHMHIYIHVPHMPLYRA